IDVAVESEVSQRLVSRTRARDIVRRALRHAGVDRAMVSVTFVSRREIARLNREHLHKKGPTDVITFAFTPVARGTPLVADVYIAPDVARENARTWGVGQREELVRVLVHGALHAAGLDHPERDRTHSAMWRRQESLVQRAGRGKK
ncbi:MAG TPA: rRNA maturation RNase YbeY, partial [Gemmatimonadaceae bacterium]|nr:rRNA maturation RNase YbeY [Gemmatimonadaceae bacterium]